MLPIEPSAPKACGCRRPAIMDVMGLPAKLLGTGETELLHLRSHGKVLIGLACGCWRWPRRVGCCSA